MELHEGFVERALSGIQIHCVPVISVFTQGLAPGIRRLIREAARQTFGDLQVHRMVGRIARVSIQSHGQELRIDHNEIFRKQLAISEKTAGLTGNGCGRIQEVRELTDVPVRDKCSR